MGAFFKRGSAAITVGWPTLLGIILPQFETEVRLVIGSRNFDGNFGARSIVFLGLFREALEFCLSTPAYAVREVKGDLADEERIVFIERLVEEGLIIRKG